MTIEMRTENKNALLIAGDEYVYTHQPRDRFLKEIYKFGNFLQRIGIPPLRIFNGTANENTNYGINIMSSLADLTSSKEITSSTPLLIAYYGHGGKDGWYINESAFIPYYFLTRVISQYNGPVLLINDCCYSWSIIEHFTKYGIAQERVGVTPAAHKGEQYFGQVVSRIAEYWQNGLYFEQPAGTGTMELTTVNIFDLGLKRPRTIRYEYTCCRENPKQLHLFRKKNPWVRRVMDPTAGKINTSTSTIREEIDLPRRWGARLDDLFFIQKQMTFL